MWKIKLLNFHHYTERSIDKYEDIDSYNDYSHIDREIFNFTFNNYISTSLDIKLEEDFKPNYLLLIKDDKIHSRWYITNISQNSGNQHKLSLKRDIIADNLDTIMNLPNTYITKGYTDINNSCFFNKEDLIVNEIPKKLYPLRDELGCPWLVAYVNKYDIKSSDSSRPEDKNPWTVNYKTNLNLSYNYEESLSTAKANLTSLYLVKDEHIYINIVIISTNYPTNAWIVQFDLLNRTNKIIGNVDQADLSKYPNYIKVTLNTTLNSFCSAMSDTFYDNRNTIINLLFPDYNKLNSMSELMNISFKYKNSIIKDSNKYYEIDNNVENSYLTNLKDTYLNNYQNLFNNILTIMKNKDSSVTSVVGRATANTSIYISTLHSYLSYTVKQLNSTDSSITISKTRRTCGNSLYDIICSPLKIKGNTLYSIDGEYYSLNDDETFSFYNNLSNCIGTSNVYDIQILPYCPIRDVLKYNSDSDALEIKLNSSDENIIYQKKNNLLLLYVNNINISFDIDTSSNNNYSNPSLMFEKDEDISKKNYLTNKYKLVSPNFSSEYEIPLYENKGILYMNVDMTLLPNNPWIKINPIYNYLNGKDLDDIRGLIIGGSLSISQISNSWTEYILQNSNYSQLFESQIAYQEYQNKMSMTSTAIQSGLTALGTGFTGGLINPVLGAIGGTASGVAGLIDNIVQAGMNKKQIEFQKEQWNLQLGNIKNKPNVLSKITSINKNFKYFPFIIHYKSTDEEIENVENYLKLNGMTINRIGKLVDYYNLDYYLAGEIKDYDNIDLNLLSSEEYEYLKNEIKQGFYLLNYI